MFHQSRPCNIRGEREEILWLTTVAVPLKPLHCVTFLIHLMPYLISLLPFLKTKLVQWGYASSLFYLRDYRRLWWRFCVEYEHKSILMNKSRKCL